MGDEMKILAILQNQWFKEPEKIRKLYARRPDDRNWLIKQFLFMGCRSGARILKAFGDDWIAVMTFEEASPMIHGSPNTPVKPDGAHVRAALEIHTPDIVLLFGKVAQEAYRLAHHTPGGGVRTDHIRVISGPHPAARHSTVQNELDSMRTELERAAVSVYDGTRRAK